jgi:hypothetical protein
MCTKVNRVGTVFLWPAVMIDDMRLSSGAEPVRKFVCGSQPEKKENDPEKDKKKR